MKKIIVLCLILVFLVFWGFAAEPPGNEFKISGEKGLTIDLKSGGTLEVTGWDQKLVKCIGEKEWKLEWKEGGDELELKVRWGGKREDSLDKSRLLKVYVPRVFDIKIKSQGGPIHVENVEGTIGGKTLGGELKLRNLKGTIDMKTMGGAITLTDSQIGGTLSTMGGRVLVENVVGDIKGSSMGGNVVYKNVKTQSGNSNGEPIRMKTMGGAIIVNHAPNGAVLHTMGGKISIKSAAKFVDAKTMGGSIDVEELDGWIKATTMGGTIHVAMVGDPGKGQRNVNLETMSGDIYLSVPEKLSMAIEVEVVMQKGQNEEDAIVSDFPLDRQIPEAWQTDNGKQVKRIIATGKTGTGKNTIKLKTKLGKISIKKNK